MKKMIFFCAVFLTAISVAVAQDAGDEDATMRNDAARRDQKAIQEAQNGWWKKSMENKDERLAWWRDARFGMFVHWGIYSEAGGEWKGKKVGGYAEHLMRKERISKEEYLELAARFNPVNFDPDKWIRTARDAGMRYFVITAKHHDGFAMYPSAFSEFDIADQTPFKRDPLAELKAACDKYGLKFGFYYSHAFDWEHPDAPGNDWEYHNPGGDQNLYGGRNWYDIHPELLPKAQKYVNEKAIPQIQELIKNYRPDILWFDTPHKLPLSENIRILEAIRAVDDRVVVNGRLARSSQGNFGDYLNTADRPAEFFPVDGDWEAIPTTNESYGYSKYDNSHKPASHFIRLLANAVSRGGNLLMNTGPKGDGSFDVSDQRILDSMAVWMKKYEESVHGVSGSLLPLQSWGVITRRDKRLYLHIFDWPSDNKLLIGGLLDGAGNVYRLGDKNKTALKTSKAADGTTEVLLPSGSFDPVDAVLVMELSDPVKIDPVRYISGAIQNNRLLAFDATLHDKSLSFGDGKDNRYYVTGWTNGDQYLSWDFKTTTFNRYKIVLKYLAGERNSGTFTLTLDDKHYEGKIITSLESVTPVFQDMGLYKLQPGIHRLSLRPSTIAGEEAMKLLEIDLMPVK